MIFESIWNRLTLLYGKFCDITESGVNAKFVTDYILLSTTLKFMECLSCYFFFADVAHFQKAPLGPEDIAINNQISNFKI